MAEQVDTPNMTKRVSDTITDANADMPASFKSEDFKEGVAHFVEKRPAKFTGR